MNYNTVSSWSTLSQYCTSRLFVPCAYSCRMGHVHVVCFGADHAVFSYSSALPWHTCLWHMHELIERIWTPHTHVRRSTEKHSSWHQDINTHKRRLRCHFTEPCGYIEWHYIQKSWECHMAMAVEEACSGLCVRTWCGFWVFEIMEQWRLILEDKWLI